MTTATFTKTYNVEPNEKQKTAISKCLKSLCEFYINNLKQSVEVVVDAVEFTDEISALLIVEGRFVSKYYIGPRGGLLDSIDF